MAKGVVITGKMLDGTTGKPVPGHAMLGVLSDNPFVKAFPRFNNSAWMHHDNTAADGTFRVVTIPGPVLLMGCPDPNRLPGGENGRWLYKPPIPDPGYPQYFTKGRQAGAFYTNAGNMTGTLPSGVLAGTYPGALTLSSASNSFTGSGRCALRS